MSPSKAPKVRLGFILIFHFLISRSPFLLLLTSRLTVVRLEETANIQTIQANFVRVNERKKLRCIYWLRLNRIEKGSRAISTSIVS